MKLANKITRVLEGKKEDKLADKLRGLKSSDLTGIQNSDNIAIFDIIADDLEDGDLDFKDVLSTVSDRIKEMPKHSVSDKVAIIKVFKRLM